MMHQSRTCERNSWTTTSMVLANQYSQLLQLNKEFFNCNECEYISRRTIESKEHLQDHQCKKYKLSHRTDIESVDKQVSSSKDEKNEDIDDLLEYELPEPSDDEDAALDTSNLILEITSTFSYTDSGDEQKEATNQEGDDNENDTNMRPIIQSKKAIQP